MLWKGRKVSKNIVDMRNTQTIDVVWALDPSSANIMVDGSTNLWDSVADTYLSIAFERPIGQMTLTKQQYDCLKYLILSAILANITEIKVTGNGGLTEITYGIIRNT